VPLPKGSDFLMQIHFHPNGLAQTEKTVVALYFGPKPTREMTQLQAPAFFGIQSNIDIPAGETDYKLRGQFTIPVDVEAVGVWAHAHYLGKEAKLTATLPNGEVRILLWIRKWEFNWQDQYLFQDLVPLPKGTRLDGELTYDNSDGNVRNPNTPAKRVRWGEQSTDEMGSLILNVVPRQAGDIGVLRLTNLAYVLTPVPLVGTRPLFVSSGLVDGASTQPGAVTPGKIVVLYGWRLGPPALAKAELGGDGRLATSLAGTELLFDGVPAPLLYSSGGQLAAVAPYALDGKLGTQVQVRSFTGTSDAVAMPVIPVAPSIFSVNLSGTGPAAILNQDGFTVNSLATPAGKGTVISIYATGEGQTEPGGIDGRIATGGSLPKPRQTVQVLIDGRKAEIQYAGAAPGQVAGLFQVNAVIPADASSGNVPIEIQMGNVRSQPGMTVAVK